MADLDYAYEKIGSALDGMASSPRPIQARLISACRSMGPVGDQHFPSDLIDEWTSFHADVTAINDANVGSYEATIRDMTDEEASEAATKLVNLRHSIELHIKDRDQRST